MRITPDFSTSGFEQAEAGALLIATMDVQGHYLVRGMKAFYQSEGGGRDAFFVTLGPFVSHHGERPVVYTPGDLLDKPVIDLSQCSTLVLPVSPQDVEIDAAEGDDALGEVLLIHERAIMRVANFGRAGPSQTIGLDLITGELTDVPTDGRCLSIRRWRILGPDDGGDQGVQYEFTL